MVLDLGLPNGKGRVITMTRGIFSQLLSPSIFNSHLKSHNRESSLLTEVLSLYFARTQLLGHLWLSGQRHLHYHWNKSPRPAKRAMCKYLKTHAQTQAYSHTTLQLPTTEQCTYDKHSSAWDFSQIKKYKNSNIAAEFCSSCLYFIFVIYTLIGLYLLNK